MEEHLSRDGGLRSVFEASKHRVLDIDGFCGSF